MVNVVQRGRTELMRFAQIGTFLFLLLGLGGIQAARAASIAQGVAGSSPTGEGAQQVSVSDPSFLLMASTSMAMSLVFSICIFFRATGAAFNPNIALTLVLLKIITPVRFVLYCIAELLGAMAAAGVLEGILPGGLNVNCAPGNGIGTAQVRLSQLVEYFPLIASEPQALFYEMFLTFALIMVVLMVLIEKNKRKGGRIAEIDSTLTLFILQHAIGASGYRLRTFCDPVGRHSV